MAYQVDRSAQKEARAAKREERRKKRQSAKGDRGAEDDVARDQMNKAIEEEASKKAPAKKKKTPRRRRSTPKNILPAEPPKIEEDPENDEPIEETTVENAGPEEDPTEKEESPEPDTPDDSGDAESEESASVEDTDDAPEESPEEPERIQADDQDPPGNTENTEEPPKSTKLRDLEEESDADEGILSKKCPRCGKVFVPFPGDENRLENGEPLCYDCESIAVMAEMSGDRCLIIHTGEQEGVEYVDAPDGPLKDRKGRTEPEDIEDDGSDDIEPEPEPPEEPEKEEPKEEPPKTNIADPYEGLDPFRRRMYEAIDAIKEKKAKSKKKDKPKTKKKDKMDPDSLSEKFRRWKLINFEGYVKLRTLDRDENSGEFVSEMVLLKRSQLPKEAVQCTGEKSTYCVDKIKDSEWYIGCHYRNMALLEYQFTASDAALYMQSNKIDNALAVNWTQSKQKDPTKMIIVMGVVLVVALVVVTRFM